MGQDPKHPSLPQAPVDAAAVTDAEAWAMPSDPPPQHPSAPFDPSRMIGIIKRKALIRNLAAVYHAECLAYCQELLELQKNFEEPFVDGKTAENDTRKEPMRPPKRMKKTR